MQKCGALYLGTPSPDEQLAPGPGVHWASQGGRGACPAAHPVMTARAGGLCRARPHDRIGSGEVRVWTLT